MAVHDPEATFGIMLIDRPGLAHLDAHISSVCSLRLIREKPMRRFAALRPNSRIVTIAVDVSNNCASCRPPTPVRLMSTESRLESQNHVRMIRAGAINEDS